jgi:hypothetical protein
MGGGGDGCAAACGAGRGGGGGVKRFFGFGKKPSPSLISVQLAELMIARPDAFADVIVSMTPGERLMTLLGRSVAMPLILACKSVARSDGFEFDVIDFAKQGEESSVENQDKNEVMSRRLWWCMMGSLIIRFDWVVGLENSEAGGRIWAALLEPLSISHTALQHNVLWKDEEKESYISGTPSQRMQLFGSLDVPKSYLPSRAIKKLAELHHLFLT